MSSVRVRVRSTRDGTYTVEVWKHWWKKSRDDAPDFSVAMVKALKMTRELRQADTENILTTGDDGE
jgi:hypothetical protein